jgi:pimeloyl-ACP methyl ester carboxylesterase
MSKIIVKELRSILPSAETIIIPNTGHGSPRVDPKAFGDAIEVFLSGQKRN